jgi:hypothetical protein
VRVDPPFLKSILSYALESEPGLRRQGGAYYVRTRDLLRPASSAAASCSDKQSECQIT